jgi:hypothetical protein
MGAMFDEESNEGKKGEREKKKVSEGKRHERECIPVSQ